MSKMAYVLIAAIIAVIAGVYYFIVRPGTLAGKPAEENKIIGGDPSTWSPRSKNWVAAKQQGGFKDTIPFQRDIMPYDYESPQRADLFKDTLGGGIGSDAPVIPAIIPINDPYKGEQVTPMGGAVITPSMKIQTDTGATITVPGGLIGALQTGVGGSIVLPTDKQLMAAGVAPGKVVDAQAMIMKELIAFQRLANGDPTVQPNFWNGTPIFNEQGYRNPDPLVPPGNPNFIAGTAGMPVGATFDPVTQSWYVRR